MAEDFFQKQIGKTAKLGESLGSKIFRGSIMPKWK